MWVCDNCGSTKVESRVFVKINDVAQTDFATITIPNTDITENYCCECEENVTLSQLEDEDN